MIDRYIDTVEGFAACLPDFLQNPLSAGQAAEACAPRLGANACDRVGAHSLDDVAAAYADAADEAIRRRRDKG